jgi:tetratricopeptide (TPR) repeat protein
MGNTILLGDSVLDLDARSLRTGRQDTRLTPREVAILQTLLTGGGQPVDRAALIHRAWEGAQVSPRAVDAAMRRLRKKIEPRPDQPRFLRTVQGGGYALLEARRPSGAWPAPLTALLGREALLEEVLDAVGHGGWVTLVGLGGAGKTRLALAAATALRDRGRRVVFLPLAGAHSAEELLVRLAEQLHIDASGEATRRAAVARELRHSSAVVLADNLEQLLGTAHSDLVWLAGAASAVLATSRAPVHVQGERLVSVSGLALPPPSPSPAAQLFLARIGSLDEPALDRVETLVAAVGGLPLAVELAAAASRTQPIDQVLARITERLGSLGGRYLDLPERHRQLAATLWSSWALLDGPKQAALAALAVFVGTPSLEAAIAVTGARGNTWTDLRQLGLIQRTQSGWALHPVVRQFAGNRLAERTADPDPRAAHARWFLQRLARNQLEGEAWPDVHAAWLHAAAQGAESLLAPAADPLFDLAIRTGRAAATAPLFAAAQQGCPQAAAPLLHALARRQAMLCARSRRTRDARTALEGVPEPTKISERALHHAVLGTIALAQAKFQEALAHAEQAEVAYRTLGRTKEATQAMLRRGSALDSIGDHASAARVFQGALAAARGLKDRHLIARILENLGHTALMRGELTASDLAYREALGLAEDLGSADHQARCWRGLGMLAEAASRWPDAASAYAKAVEGARSIGQSATIDLVSLGRAKAAIGEAESGLAALQQATDIELAANGERGAFIPRVATAEVLVEIGREQEAIAVCKTALASIPADDGSAWIAVFAHIVMANALRGADQAASAQHHAASAARLAPPSPTPWLAVDIAIATAKAHAANSQPEHAHGALARAAAIARARSSTAHLTLKVLDAALVCWHLLDDPRADELGPAFHRLPGLPQPRMGWAAARWPHPPAATRTLEGWLAWLSVGDA